MLCVNFATKYYSNCTALEKVYLEVSPGEIVGVLGDNGAGKTTLLKAIMNLVKLNSGEITVDGKPVRDETYSKLSFITEEGSCFREFSAYEHECFYRNMVDGFDSGRFYKLLDFFNLDPGKKVRAMSRGERAKLEMAIGFSKGAKYILMDEPFMGKDVFTRRDFLKLMIANLRDDESVILTTHLIDEIENILSRAVILKTGRKVCDIKMSELEEQGRSLYDLMKEIKGYKEERISDTF